jgi:SpoVK/Ycf46/Vps4 family AAA+-type ATPase
MAHPLVRQQSDAVLSAFTAAKAAEEAQQYDAAVEQYTEGIEMLMSIVQIVEPGPRREKLLQDIEHFMGKAEIVKAKAKANEAKRTENTSSSSTVLNNVMSYMRPTSSRKAQTRAVPSSARSDPALERTGPLNAHAGSSGAIIPSRHTASAARPASTARQRASSAGATSSTSRSAASAASSRSSSESDKRYADLEAVILNEIQDSSPGVAFDDIAGLTEAKQILQEAVILPHLR